MTIEILEQWYDQSDLPESERQEAREQLLRDWVANGLSDYFHVLQEVDGRTLRDTTKGVRIDVLCAPKQKTIGYGFANTVFGIECKYPLGWDDDKPVTKWASQMITYRHSWFSTKRGNVVPSFILSSPPISEFVSDPKFTSRILHQLGLGELKFRKGKSGEVVFEIRFGVNTPYWSSRTTKIGPFPGKDILGLK